MSILPYANCFAQQANTSSGKNKIIDSLLALVKMDRQDSMKVIHSCKLCNEFRKKGTIDSAILFGNAAIQLAKQVGYQKGLADSYNNVGLVYENLGNYPEALKNYFSSLKIYEAIGNQKSIAFSYNNIGNVYIDQGNLAEALKNHFAALKIRETIGDKNGIAQSHNNIGNAYADQGKYADALSNYLASLKIREETKDQTGIASAYNNIGLIYSHQGKYREALDNYFASLKIKEEVGNKSGMAACYTNIGEVFIKQKKYKEAEAYLWKAKDLSIEIGYMANLRNTYLVLTDLDSSRGNFRGAYENHKLYILYRDSMDNEDTRNKTIQSQMNYEFDKKEAVANVEHKKELENQEVLANEKSRKQNIIIGFVVCGLLLVLIFAGFILKSLRVTRKQKFLIEEQKVMVEEKQREILDSIRYAKKIQQSLFPTEKYIERNLNNLKQSK